MEDKIKELLKEYLISYPSLFLVNVKISGKGQETNKISVFLDGEQGVSIDQCAAISRKLGNDLEERNLIENAYNLEVSSPGLDQPLMVLQQYVRNRGRDIQVEQADGKLVTGRLEEVSEKEISVLEHDKSKNKSKKYSSKTTAIPFEEIKKTIVLVSFN